MKHFTANQLRTAFLDFFKERGHAIMPSASLIPENDPTVLFTTAGMHPLVPYLLGEKHPLGTRLTNSQKCIRTDDIDDVGDHRHLTFFEMLGIWSLGDYFKAEVIPWSFEFFTRVMEFEPNRLYVSVFEGEGSIPQDDESIELWKAQFASAGITATVATPEECDIASGHRIFMYGKKKNWWGPAGQTGPCGPATEIFYDTGMPHDAGFGATCHPNCDCGRFIEIGNDVLMQFNKTSDGAFEPLAKKNVDVGWGFERLLAMSQGKTSIFETELFTPVMEEIGRLSAKRYGLDIVTDRSFEVIADHLRAATFILADPRGIVPSNVGQGYILRRFVRRAIRHARVLGISEPVLGPVAELFISIMGDAYPELVKNREKILAELVAEEVLFRRTLESGEKHFTKLVEEHQKDSSWNGVLGGVHAFHLYDTYGFPIEMTEELAKEAGYTVDRAGYDEAFLAHQETSRAGSSQKFAGGLADHSDRTVRLHTATHLLHMALRTVLGAHVEQRGSNITPERLRFDFPHPEKVTPEQLKAVEDMVNVQVERDLPIWFTEMTVPEAKSQGVIGLFEDRYGERVKVYTVGDGDAVFSREICGGPHVAHSALVGRVRIQKEEASSKGIRRIKAIVEDDPSFLSPIPTAERRE